MRKTLPEPPVVKYVDAICGSGKSFLLKKHIKSGGAVFKRFLIVLPTLQLCDQFKSDLKSLKIETVLISSEEESATLKLKKALAPDYFPEHIICTHEAFKHYCYQAFHNLEMQTLLRGVDVYIDEVPAATFGAYIHVNNAGLIDKNYPFLAWIEERNGLWYVKDEYYADLREYWKEKNANSKDLKQLLWVLLTGGGMLLDIDRHFFAYTANPVLWASVWASECVIMSAGIERSEFIWWAQNAFGAAIERADKCLWPAAARSTYLNQKVTLLAVMENNASFEQLEHVFKNHLHTLRNRLGSGFIYATNRDKRTANIQCDFSQIAERDFGEHGGEVVSMCSYGLNDYQSFHKAAFLGCSNDNRDVTGKWATYCELNAWDWDEVAALRKAARNYEQCYQFVSRCSIRDFSKSIPQTYVVPDMATAKYLKEHYFIMADIEGLGFDKPKTERNDTKGDQTLAIVLGYYREGLKQRDVVIKTGLSKGRVSQLWKQIKQMEESRNETT